MLARSVSVQKAPLAKTHEAFVSRTATENTGFAMYNPSLTATSQSQLRLLDKNGNQVAGPVSLSLLPRQQLPIFINNAALFQAYLDSVTGDFEGTVKLVVQSGGPISVVSLIQTSSGALLAVPVDSEVTGP